MIIPPFCFSDIYKALLHITEFDVIPAGMCYVAVENRDFAAARSVNDKLRYGEAGNIALKPMNNSIPAETLVMSRA